MNIDKDKKKEKKNSGKSPAEPAKVKNNATAR